MDRPTDPRLTGLVNFVAGKLSEEDERRPYTAVHELAREDQAGDPSAKMALELAKARGQIAAVRQLVTGWDPPPYKSESMWEQFYSGYRNALTDVGRALDAGQTRWTVSEHQAPPDWVAYAEDNRDRLWTGRGLGTWRCLTDASNETRGVPQSWASLWRNHGPITPLVPYGREG